MLLDAPHLPTELLDDLRRADLDPSDLSGRDPEFIERYGLPLCRWLSRSYFRASYEGLDNLPDAPFIAVAVHSGAPLLPDVWPMLAVWWERFPLHQPGYALVHDAAFRIPVVRNLLIKLGALRATPENAARVLEAGGTVLIFPGGDVEAMREFRSRHTVNFHGRTGVIRLALEHGVPLVPVVNVGGHEVFVVLTSGRRLAEWTGVARITRIRALPVVAGLPWGLWVGGMLPYLPLPARIDYKVGQPLPFPHAPELGGHEPTLRREAGRVQDTMQRMTWELAARRRLPVVG
jgi:1-acyl-sn-glycerol-3-phosphate acyltransferase